MHLVQLTSRDGGVTWSQPRFLTPAVKDEDCLFLGTGPGVGRACAISRTIGRTAG